MREILFRGKRLDNGEWIEGHLLTVTLREETGYLIFVDSFKIVCGEVKASLHALVDPDTVGQYTGLTDKNGKRIFEGDIIECWSEGVKARGTVQQNMGGLWIIYPAWQKTIMWGLCPNEDGSTDVEIIGNIHENPELLKDGEG